MTLSPDLVLLGSIILCIICWCIGNFVGRHKPARDSNVSVALGEICTKVADDAGTSPAPPPPTPEGEHKDVITVNKLELAKFIEIARQAAVYDALIRAVDREMPPLPADVGAGDVTSILTLLETRALSADRDVAQRARQDIQVMQERVAAQKRIDEAVAAIQYQYGAAARRYMFIATLYS